MQRRANGNSALVQGAVHTGIRSTDRIVLAVSGGRDSMALLDAMLEWRRGAIAAVATFDHGTGDFARAAADLVERRAREAGIVCKRGTATLIAPREAAWRSARWEFLTAAAREFGARVATAHTEDDQVETVCMRIMRGAGARGIAGLFAESVVARPLLAVSRATVTAYASERNVEFVDDPTNESRAYFRNRVRLDFLPAAERMHPGFSRELLALSRAAATWRAGVEQRVEDIGVRREGRSIFVTARTLLAYDAQARAHLWPALAARAGVVLDRRGTTRLAAFSTRTRRINRIQLAGGHEVVRHADTFEIRPAETPVHHP